MRGAAITGKGARDGMDLSFRIHAGLVDAETHVVEPHGELDVATVVSSDFDSRRVTPAASKAGTRSKAGACNASSSVDGGAGRWACTGATGAACGRAAILPIATAAGPISLKGTNPILILSNGALLSAAAHRQHGARGER